MAQVLSFLNFGIIERGVPHQGVTAKMHSWTRVRRNGAFGARAQVFESIPTRGKAFWYVSKPAWIHLGYVSMRACVVFGSGSRGVPPSTAAPLRFQKLHLHLHFSIFSMALSRFSGIFPIFSGMVRGFSRFVPFLFLGLLKAPTRNSPERVRDTIWTFPEKKWETPRFGNPFCTLTLEP